MKRGLVAVLGAGGTLPPSPSTMAVHVVDAKGMKDGEAATVRVEGVTVAHGRWGIALQATGVVAPEQMPDPATFLPASSRTGCSIAVVGP